VYGFDTGSGLPDSDDYRDYLHAWRGGFYPMDIELIKKRLRFAQLVIGDVKETCRSFMEDQTFAPIGTMLIDVDYYSSTVPILNMLLGDTRKFLPRVYLYFDDINGYLEHLGELLAISEFNRDNSDVKISRLQLQNSRLFLAHLFKHDKYAVCYREIPTLEII